MKSSFQKSNYTNSFGHVIDPGDSVVAVGSGRGRTSVRVGVYLGLNELNGKMTSVRVQVKARKWNRKTYQYEEVLRNTAYYSGRIYPLR